MNHVSKIIIIIIIIIKKKDKSQMGRRRRKKVREVREFLFLFFLLFVSFLDLRKSNRRFSSRLKAKLIMRGLRVSTKILEFRQTPRGKEFFYLCYF